MTFEDIAPFIAAPLALGLIALIALAGDRLLYAGIFFAAALAAAALSTALMFTLARRPAPQPVEVAAD